MWRVKEAKRLHVDGNLEGVCAKNRVHKCKVPAVKTESSPKIKKSYSKCNEIKS